MKTGLMTIALVLLLTGCSQNKTTYNCPTLIKPALAEQIVFETHQHNPNGKVIITSVSHVNGAYEVHWKVDSKIVTYGTDYVSDTTGKIIRGTETIQ